MFRLTELIIMYAAAAAMLCIESLRVWALARTHLNQVNSNLFVQLPCVPQEDN